MKWIEYDPFGGLISATGSESTNNPFRFSTKYWDDETGLGYWGFRYYSPGLGRWVSRDPVGEDGGVHLYGFIGNVPSSEIDFLGLLIWAPCCDAGEKDQFIGPWVFDGAMPAGKTTVGGAGGFNTEGLTLRWKRDFRRKYICCGTKTVWQEGWAGYVKSVRAGDDGDPTPLFFKGPAGPWNPIPIGSNLVKWFIDAMGKLMPTPQWPWPHDKRRISKFESRFTPSRTMRGQVVEEPDIPWRWCW